MTDAEWDRSQIPHLLAEALGRDSTSRKRRLCLCAYSRLLLPRNSEEAVGVIGVADQFADQVATLDQLKEANALARDQARRRTNHLGYTLLNRTTLQEVSSANMNSAVHLIYRLSGLSELQLSDVIRDIFGNPFRPAIFSPEWRTDTAVTLARTMYDSREFGAMPILADALQDAGCDNADVLNHCRDANQVHVRGCWVVDGVLGKA